MYMLFCFFLLLFAVAGAHIHVFKKHVFMIINYRFLFWFSFHQ